MLNKGGGALKNPFLIDKLLKKVTAVCGENFHPTHQSHHPGTRQNLCIFRSSEMH